MNKHTRTMFFIALGYSITLGLLLVFGIFQTKAKGSDLIKTQKLIAEQAAKESAHYSLEQILKSTTDDRAKLQKFFITEKDAITFVNNIEAAATALGVMFETTQLSINPQTDTSPAQLYTGFKFSGPEASVKHLVTLFEAVPYHKSIPELTLARNTDTGLWDGSILLYITISP